MKVIVYGEVVVRLVWGGIEGRRVVLGVTVWGLIVSYSWCFRFWVFFLGRRGDKFVLVVVRLQFIFRVYRVRGFGLRLFVFFRFCRGVLITIICRGVMIMIISFVGVFFVYVVEFEFYVLKIMRMLKSCCLYDLVLFSYVVV